MMDFKIKGIPAFTASLQKLAKEVPEAARAGLYLALEYIMTDAKQHYVPVRDGILRASGFVEMDPVKIKGTIGFGGPAGTGNTNGETNSEDVEYAILQHENMDFAHKVGEAKYLERPLFEAIGSGMIEETMVAEIQRRTGIS